MKKIFILFTFVFPAIAFSQKHYWQQQVDYVIDVSLNDTEHTLEAMEKMEYTNHSPDTLHFIWFHIWPNAYKNDRTAFSEQMLQNDRTEFYFSDEDQKGYINKLDFRVNGTAAKIETDSAHIDIIRLMLPSPLLPGKSITISTPFHVKLPFNFSRGGHVKQSYQVTQWYPKPAVYDRKGWHPMPYLDQGEFFSEFGTYDVRITLPDNYVVAATGELQNDDELKRIRHKATLQTAIRKTGTTIVSTGIDNNFPPSSAHTKTLRYIQKNVHDFAWFADKRFIVDYDTLKLSSGRIIDVFSYYLPSAINTWKNSIRFIKDAVRSRNEWIGEYPYSVVSAAEVEVGYEGGMEYPTITSISPAGSRQGLDETIAHELAHNWLYGAVANNERTFPWMDEGMNTFYDNRYHDRKYRSFFSGPLQERIQDYPFISKRLPVKSESLIFETLAETKLDQPINTPAQEMSALNYQMVTYFKTGEWMRKLETYLGRPVFNASVRAYFREWKFRHPYPEDFKRIVDSVSGRNTDAIFQLLAKKGSLLSPARKTVETAFVFNLKDTHKKNYISFLPAAGVNLYDGVMLGGMIHNYQLPLNPFSFFVIPLFATQSTKLNLLARATYNWYPDQSVYNITAGLNVSRFSMNSFQREGMANLYAGFLKLAPFIRVNFKQPGPLSKLERYIQFKSYLIREEDFDFNQIVRGSDTSNTVNLVSQWRNLNQLTLVIRNRRILYPYRMQLQLEQQKGFARASFDGNYFFNYSNQQGGMLVRLFAGKFMYTGTRTIQKQAETDRYHLNLTGASGNEDYTYSNYFIGRNKFDNWGSQQIMIRDGGFKVRTDLLSSKIGKTDDWLIAANFITDIPAKINPLQVLPFKVPLKIFADLGSYAEAWNQNASSGKVLFDAGLQLSLMKETLNIYLPLLYSSVFRDYFRSTLGSNRFLKTISFSIDIQNLSWQQLDRKIPF